MNELREKKAPSRKRIVLFSILGAVVLFALISIGRGGESHTSAPAAVESAPAATPIPTYSETAVATAAAQAIPDADSVDAVAAFKASATGDLADLDKDLNDMVERASNAQLIRLTGNLLELSFNLGQLQALTPPSAVAASWNTGVVELEASISSASDATSQFVTGGIALDTMLSAIESVRTTVQNLSAIASGI